MRADVTDEELVHRFADLAQKMGVAVSDSETRRANRIFDQMGAIDKVLRSRNSRSKLVPLLESKNRFVRYYAASYLLAIEPERARAVIELNHRRYADAIAGAAGMKLYALDSGIYKPD